VTGENIGGKDSDITELSFDQDDIDKYREEYENIFGDNGRNETYFNETTDEDE
jgi:hypothetical protein